MAKNRLIGEYPIIGIRPTIDGRQGPLNVRAALEEQTMNMAKAAAKLFKKHIRYTNGESVKVIIADTTIGRVAEAAACAEKFKKAGVDITLTVTPCWCYGSETMDMDPMTIKAVWGFNGTERPGAVYLAAVLAAHSQKGLPAFGIYGKDVQEADAKNIPADVQEKLLRFARAAVAAATMRGKSYLQIGSICMGIAGSIVDPSFFESYLGMRVESVDEVEIIRRMTEGVYDKAEYEKALAWTKKNCPEGIDMNPDNMKKSAKEKAESWEFHRKDDVHYQRFVQRKSKSAQGLLGRKGRAQRDCGRFPRSAPMDGLLPELRLPRSYAELVVRLGRRARALRFGNRKRHAQRRFHALRQTAYGPLADFLRRENVLERRCR